MKVVIVGGVAGGASAAARLRRLDEKAEIVIFERSGHMSYANCGLPYYIGDVIREEGALTLQTPQSFYARFRIPVKLRHEVTAILPEEKCVAVKELDTGREFKESYDKLILAPGASPTKPRLPGIDLPKLFTLRTVEDTLRIKDYVNKKKPRSVILAGGGFIGLELAENLRQLGLEVGIVEGLNQLMSPFDPEMAAFIHGEMRRNGVKLHLGSFVDGFREADGGVEVLLKSGEALRADMGILAIGVTPDTALARAAGLELGLRGSILVNDRMETSVPDIYAVGDAVQVKQLVTGEDSVISLAGPANKQGRIAADNICGRDSRYPGSLGTSVIKVFDMAAASTGVNEATAKKAGLQVDKLYLSPMSHATYYPGGELLNMKILFEKDTWRLLGAQIVGGNGTDKRIDVIAAAIQGGLDVRDLADLQLAYAPPFAAAKDPVNMAGYMAENLSNGLVKQIHWHDVDGLSRESSVLLDVRTVPEYERGHAKDFVNIPLHELRERMGEIPAGKPVYVMCQSALRSYIGCRILTQYGFDCYNIAGGYRLYSTVLQDAEAAKTAAPCGKE
ncbi:MAG: FAD-dependent oxidoreductase [Oscillospiraceae bacterium]|nr:FAD-dependent oxidoreductase [Oscillospiraceae bacterium]